MEDPQAYATIAPILRRTIESIKACRNEVIASRLQEATEHLGVYFAQLLSLRRRDVVAVAIELREGRYREVEAHRGNIHDRMVAKFAAAARHDLLAQSAA